MNSFNSKLKEATQEFLEQASLKNPYRMLGNGEEPFDAEGMLLMRLKETMPLVASDVTPIRELLDLNGAYHLETFAKRMANHAVRVKDPSLINPCAYGFVFDNDFVEWRDVLIDLAIFEDCAQRLEVDFDGLFGEIAGLCTAKRKETIVDGYLVRAPNMRGLEIMKVEASGPDHDLIYTRIPW